MKILTKVPAAGIPLLEQALRAMQGGYSYFVFNERLYKTSVRVDQAALYNLELQDYIEKAPQNITSIDVNEADFVREK